MDLVMVIIGTLLAISAIALGVNAIRIRGLWRRRSQRVCAACGYSNIEIRGVEPQCPECGLQIGRARQRWRRMLMYRGSKAAGAAAILLIGTDLLAVHVVPWRKFLPLTALVAVRRTMPWIDADSELRERLITDSGRVRWCDQAAIWDWQWRHIYATRPSFVSCEGPELIDRIASAVCGKETDSVPADSLLLQQDHALSVRELRALQGALGIAPCWWSDSQIVSVAKHRVDFEGKGRIRDLVLVLSVPDSWDQQLWILRPKGGDSQSFRLDRTIDLHSDPLGAGPDIADLGAGCVLLSFEADACRGTNVRLGGRVCCALPPRDLEDTWMLPKYGYCGMPGPGGRWYRLGDVKWSIESNAEDTTVFAADLTYTIGYEGEPDANAWHYQLRVVLARSHDEGELRICRDISGVLVPGIAPTFVPGVGVPAEVAGLWKPFFHDPQTLHAEVARNLSAHALGSPQSQGEADDR